MPYMCIFFQWVSCIGVKTETIIENVNHDVIRQKPRGPHQTRKPCITRRCLTCAAVSSPLILRKGWHHCPQFIHRAIRALRFRRRMGQKWREKVTQLAMEGQASELYGALKLLVFHCNMPYVSTCSHTSKTKTLDTREICVIKMSPRFSLQNSTSLIRPTKPFYYRLIPRPFSLVSCASGMVEVP